MLSGRLAPWLGVLGLGAGGGILLNSADSNGSSNDVQLLATVPTRQQQVAHLSSSRPNQPFELLVIGGGATGCGIAVDAATRGLRTALIERQDFASGTSSKSTKLVHGGVRYLEKAVFNLDYGQLKLVYEALQERRSLLDNAPHLTHTLPILMPCYKWWEVPFYWAGLKAYDIIAGTRNLAWSKYLPPSESHRQLPTLAEQNHEGKGLKGAILYYDGQFDDARLTVALATTAAAAGAAVANYVEATGFIRDGDGQVVGVHCRDRQTGRKFDILAKVIINAAGPYVDKVRELGNKDVQHAVTGSSGSHVTLPEWYGSMYTGMIVPKTKDGRVVFMLPFQGHIVAGTTDHGCDVTDRPTATADEVKFILDAISDFLSIRVRPEDVLSTWSGIRPLAADPTISSNGTTNTSSISRDHLIFTDPDGLVTITGGKWTTYRRMAQDAVDTALATGRIGHTHQCVTSRLKLLGGQGYKPTLYTEVAQQASSLLPISAATARHLAAAYGDQAGRVLQIAADEKLGQELVHCQPYIEAEVVHACRCAQGCQSAGAGRQSLRHKDHMLECTVLVVAALH
eukprot:GHRR01011940.1.p1 GENE.GHRR01011940.1~~GHRR01011940.1.p1  ORF type:complete len:569 (+),score=148.55 GHRR01011940.1:94-1800(+)